MQRVGLCMKNERKTHGNFAFSTDPFLISFFCHDPSTNIFLNAVLFKILPRLVKGRRHSSPCKVPMRPISPHDRFFSSLNRVEKRLASEKEPISFATPPSPISFGSPLYLSSPKPQPASFKPSALDESSGPAPEFLSIPSPMVYDPAPPLKAQKDEFKYEEDEDEIDRLISLLGLSANGEEGDGGLGSCHCSGGEFYRRAVGVKGPICEKEMGRLDGWIEHYRRERREPARLAHLLLAKAVSMEASRGGDDDDDDDAFGAIGFPPTVEEFLEHDPPFQKDE